MTSFNYDQNFSGFLPSCADRTITDDFWRAFSLLSLFVARVASFAPARREGANDATRDTNKLYTRQK